MSLRAPRRTLLALSGAVLLTSCLFGRGDPTRFYVLSTTVAPSNAANGALGIGLGPIAMPGYLRRPMLAVRVDGTQVRYADFDRWAEPLPTQFARTLGRDLSALADSARIVPYPWYPATGVDVVVRVDVSAFEADVHGNARLDACWTIRDPRTAAVRREDCSSIAEAVDADDPQRQVAALSRTVGELAQRIASGLPSSAH
jgi:uncharacterized lipoprotein YmbA